MTMTRITAFGAVSGRPELVAAAAEILDAFSLDARRRPTLDDLAAAVRMDYREAELVAA
jgi:hypothetical protein